MLQPLNRATDQPLYLQIHDQIRHLILAGDLPVGTRLPSERELAERLAVNRTTVSKAYQELYADGLVEGQVGYGTVVCTIPGEVSPTRPLPWPNYFAATGRQSQDPLHGLFVLSGRENFISLAPDRRARTLGLWITLSTPLIALGPSLAGWLVDSASWRAVFLINVPLGLLACFIARRYIPENERQGANTPLDWLGMVALMVGLGTLMLIGFQANLAERLSPLPLADEAQVRLLAQSRHLKPILE